MADRLYTGLVLAASRGHRDPLALAGGVSHKCFIDIAGQPMLRRVVQGVLDCGRVGRTIVAIEPDSMAEARRLLADLPGAEGIDYVPSRENIGTSVAAVAAPDLLPLIITTGDNALHTAEMVRYFCDSLDDVDADGALGLTPARYVLDKYPEGNRAFHRFRDGAFSSCNLYALLTPRALAGVRVFDSGGQFGKKPRRLIGAFGLFAFLLYKSRLFSLATVVKALSRTLGLRIKPIPMPFAEGPIDVDRMQDWELANRIVRDREAAAGGAPAAPAKFPPH
ncbi:MAG TPA: NTP transferase domain-containing protein [Allosphingosinicella sp.]|nr:NTP transferase domain-containing protein [Allosphingosinicella sp.]